MTDEIIKSGEQPYQYRESGLDNVYLYGGIELKHSAYGDSVAIHDLEGLHRCIAQCLVEKPSPLTGAEFRFLRTELDLSQFAMGQLCGREERSVRNWETSHEPVQEPANTIIRFVYTQRFNPSANFEELSKHIQLFQHVDKALHEMKLRSTAAGWKPAECGEAKAA
jgi:DNA-binding transcriptional regulator YiaG